ncbi:GSCOCG00012142001-RA-CDS [Cotesia congregata]|nr:GSCOCG00012142001-RA-CDS [Cotesia congregata]
MSKVYKSEAFIVPVSNREVKNDNNVIDDVKISKMKNEENFKIESSSDKNIKHEVVDSAESTYHLPIIKNDNANKKLKFNDTDDKEMKPSQEVIYDVPLSLLKNKKLQPAEFHNQLAQKDDKKNYFINSNIYNAIDEPIYKVPYSSSSYEKPGYTKYRERFETAEYVTSKLLPKQNVINNNNKYLLLKPPMRTSSLMSIDERDETPEDCSDELCCHGNKNGCTTTTKRPEAVTEEIFEINWMKRLEQLRAREAVIKDKEVMLYDREKLLFKKEKELRILERLLKDKLNHAELYLKRKSQIIDTINLNDIENKFTKFFKAPSYSSSKSGVSTLLSSTESLESYQQSDKILTEVSAQTDLKSCGSSTTGVNFSENNHMKNPPNSRSSLVTVNIGSLQSQALRLENASSNLVSRNTLPISAYSSCRSKRRQKMTYDDLDSTLSADIGDSSLVITSRKFDPEIFKKPYIFTRSSSERHQKIINDKIPECNYENEKTLKRISDSIINSYDKNTKFQNYGLIDLRVADGKKSDNISDNNINKRYSYLDLEDGKKYKGSLRVKKDKKLPKDRPISWNEESNEWLQKKRQAYNLQTAKKMATESFSNKENYSSHLKLNSNQTLKKNSKEKKFSIFR